MVDPGDLGLMVAHHPDFVGRREGVGALIWSTCYNVFAPEQAFDHALVDLLIVGQLVSDDEALAFEHAFLVIEGGVTAVVPEQGVDVDHGRELLAEQVAQGHEASALAICPEAVAKE